MSAAVRSYVRAKAVLIGYILDADRTGRPDEHAIELAWMDFENARADLV